MSIEREQFIKEMELEGDGIVRSHISVTYPVWKEYGEKLKWLERFSPYVSVGIAGQSSREPYETEDDIWGCKWIYPLEALDGQCIEHPLDDWSRLESYTPPDPEKHTDWKKAKEDIQKAKSEGRVAWGRTDHGFIFLRLTYLRGFENFMLDLGERRPQLNHLISIVENYWMEVVRRWVELGVDAISFGDDLGLQHSLPISPSNWRQYIKPSYKRIFSFCRSRGVYVSLHSDGYIVDIIPDLIECGVSILNPQDFVNGIVNIARLAKGKVHIKLDIDRQRLTVFGRPEENESHILDCIRRLGSPKGGLSFVWGVYPPTPLENIEAVARAMDRYANYWAE